MLPRRPIFIMSPKRRELVGSPTTQASIVSPRSASFFSILTVPLTAGPSSSPVIRRLIEPPKSRPRLAMNRADGLGEGRDRALHVGGAAAEQVAGRQLGRERTDRPRREIADRHDVGMAGEAEVLAAWIADAGIEVGDVVGAGLGEIHALAAEADGAERALEQLQRARFDRRHALAAHQRARQFNHVGDGRSKVSGMGGHYIRQAPKRRAPARVQADAQCR